MVLMKRDFDVDLLITEFILFRHIITIHNTVYPSIKRSFYGALP